MRNQAVQFTHGSHSHKRCSGNSSFSALILLYISKKKANRNEGQGINDQKQKHEGIGWRGKLMYKNARLSEYYDSNPVCFFRRNLTDLLMCNFIGYSSVGYRTRRFIHMRRRCAIRTCTSMGFHH